MGDIADEIIDSMIDRAAGFGMGGHRRRRCPRIVTCRHCGETDLRWQNIKGGEWRLFTRDGKRHICQIGVPE